MAGKLRPLQLTVPEAVPIPVYTNDPGVAEVADTYAAEFLDAAEHIRVELRLVTPQWAADMLAKKNNNNRSLSAQTWKRFRDTVVRENWGINGECIVFGRSGNLLNGQHRLTATANQRHAVPMMIVYGVKDEMFYSFDQGKRRNGGDTLSVLGKENSHTLASALSWQHHYESGRMLTCCGKTVSNDMLPDLADAHPDMEVSVRFVHGEGKTRRVPNGLLAWLHYQLTFVDHKVAVQFLTRICSGTGIEEGSNEHLLARRLEGLIGRRGPAEVIEIAALVIKTWGRIRRNETPKFGKDSVLSWRVGEAFPDIEA
jgi:hypothetical protein